MDKFDNRLKVQRNVIRTVNKYSFPNEQLAGLSREAILRWSEKNNIKQDSEIISILKSISQNLSFLTSRSQAPIEPDSTINIDYFEMEIDKLADEIHRIKILK